MPLNLNSNNDSELRMNFKITHYSLSHTSRKNTINLKTRVLIQVCFSLNYSLKYLWNKISHYILSQIKQCNSNKKNNESLSKRLTFSINETICQTSFMKCLRNFYLLTLCLHLTQLIHLMLSLFQMLEISL